MSYCIRLIVCAILLACLIVTFGLGLMWIVEHILSDFWATVLIVLFTSSAYVVAVLITGFLFMLMKRFSWKIRDFISSPKAGLVGNTLMVVLFFVLAIVFSQRSIADATSDNLILDIVANVFAIREIIFIPSVIFIPSPASS